MQQLACKCLACMQQPACECLACVQQPARVCSNPHMACSSDNVHMAAGTCVQQPKHPCVCPTSPASISAAVALDYPIDPSIQVASWPAAHMSTHACMRPSNIH
eukprot:364999-Chlamydomonas_euryale.AAC.21